MQAVNGSGELWAITSFFNPVGYRRRLENFHTFRARLDLPLVAVELAYGKDFELSADDAEILIRLRGRDVLWQKERLLNVALAALPPECTKVVWIDCDVFFDDPDWHLRLGRLLDEVPIAQAYARSAFLKRDWTPGSGDEGVVLWRPSRSAAVEAWGSADACFRGTDRNKTGSPGFAWGARRDLLQRHGLYDASIIGGGDRLLASAAYGILDATDRIDRGDPVRRAHYLRWAEPFAEEVAGQVGYVDTTVRSLWHGDLGDRKLDERFHGLLTHGYDPNTDIAVDEGGAWRWSSDKPGLHAYVRDYFASRREDG